MICKYVFFTWSKQIILLALFSLRSHPSYSLKNYVSSCLIPNCGLFCHQITCYISKKFCGRNALRHWLLYLSRGGRNPSFQVATRLSYCNSLYPALQPFHSSKLAINYFLLLINNRLWLVAHNATFFTRNCCEILQGINIQIHNIIIFCHHEIHCSGIISCHATH